ncbi:MAG: nucleotidyltransferase [Campylobacteraceae bacterium]|nr:nucleotidyltransferase [Campylobacteraceae bacterium]
MAHIDELLSKYQDKRKEVKELIESNYKGKIYNPLNSGSYAKSTAINCKFDLDVVVPFKRSSFNTLEELFDDVYELLYEKYYDVATVRKQKVSIGIEFYSDEDGDVINLDIVPGRELNEDKYIEDKKLNLYVNSQFGLLAKNTYIQTNIDAQIQHIKAKQNERKIIRLLKIWKYRNSEKYKSFLIELITIKAFDKSYINGNLWEQLKSVMEYIENNVNQENFTLKDPGNSNNNVIETLTEYEREEFSNDMRRIIKNIEDDENDIKIYFPMNEEFEEDNSENRYGVKEGSASLASVPPDTRFG